MNILWVLQHFYLVHESVNFVMFFDVVKTPGEPWRSPNNRFWIWKQVYVVDSMNNYSMTHRQQIYNYIYIIMCVLLLIKYKTWSISFPFCYMFSVCFQALLTDTMSATINYHSLHCREIAVDQRTGELRYVCAQGKHCLFSYTSTFVSISELK